VASFKHKQPATASTIVRTLTWYGIGVLVGVLRYQGVLDVPPAHPMSTQEHQRFALEVRIPNWKKAQEGSGKINNSSPVAGLEPSNPPGTLTTSSYVTTSSVSKMALCLARYLSRHCFFLRPKMEQLTVGYNGERMLFNCFNGLIEVELSKLRAACL